MNRGQWLAWWTSVGLVIGIVGSLTGQQADTVTRPAGATIRPGTALQEAINLYRKGEYEEAAKFFEMAQQSRQQLTPTEQQRLDDYRSRNEAARLGRQQTLQQLQAVQEAVKNGQWSEAENLLKQLRSSKYLKPEEQALVNQLSDQVNRRHGRRWSLFSRETNSPRADAESLLAQGREALKNNELDRAETLARQAKEAGYSAIFPWSDSPDKLLRDIQAARSRQQPGHATAAAAPDADQLLTQAREALRQGDLDRAEQLAQQAKQAGHSSWWPWSDTPDKVLRDVQQARQAQRQATPQQLKLQQARRLLYDAHQAVQRGELDKAKQLLAQAEQLQVPLPPYEPYTPDKIRQAIAQAEQSRQTSAPPATTANSPNAPSDSDSEPIRKENARAKLKQARQLFEAGRLDQAEALARRIRVVPDCRWGLFEDTPDKLLADIYKARQEEHRQQADALLAQARQKLEQGKFDEAEKLAYQARALQPHYSIWHRGEHPDRLLAEIKARRQQANRPRIPDNNTATASPKVPQPLEVSPAKQQAQMLLVQARAALQAGQLVQALQLARQARQYPVTWAADEDSPDQIEKAVEALLAQQRDRDQPEQAARVRQQALLLLADARELQRQGQVLAALRRAREAQKLRVAFRPEDETPEQVILDLQRQAQNHIETFNRAAATWKQMGRYTQAEQCLRYVRSLQSELHLDTLQTDQQLAELQRLRQGESVAQLPNQDEGRRLLEQARRELRAGELLRAQELARRVYTDHAHLRVEASQLLAEIDDAQYRQSVREANRFYELGVRAYSRGEYAQAAAYFQSINPRLLDERKRAHVQEILSSKEMQAHALVQAGQLPPTPESAPGQATATDRDKPASSDQAGNLLDKVQQQREVELQRLRRIKLEAERQANRFAQNNELDKAADVLRQALQELKHSPLDNEAVLAMQRQLEQRLRTFEASREQLTYERLRQDTLRGSSPREREILADINRKEQVAQLMHQYSQYLKEAKYKEAEVVAMKAKELDPDNPAAEAALFRARTLRALSDEERIKYQKERGFELAMQSVNESSAAPESDLQYPKDWAERNRRRNKAIPPLRPETPEDRDLYQRLQQPVSIDFRDKPLSEVLDHLRSLYGINIVPDEPALQAAGISLNQPVTIRLDNRPLRTCLNLILQNARLTWIVRDGVYIVTTEEGKRGKLVQKVYPVADLILPVQDFGNVGNNSASILSVIQQNMNNQQPALTAPWTLPGGTTVSQGSMASGTSPGQPQVKVEPPKTASLEKTLIRLIHETIEPKSWDVAGGPGHIDYYPLGMQLVVSADPEIQEQVEQLLRRLRELQELQVTVEVRFITLSEAFYERIGIDFNFKVDDDQTRFDRMVVANSFAPPGMINEPDHLDKVVVGLAPGNVLTPDLDIPFFSSSFSRAIPPFGNFPNAVGNNGGLNFGFAYLSDIEVFLFMEAAQGDTRTNVMQAPKITLFSGQTAYLTVQDFQFLVTGATPLIGPFGQVTLVPTVTPFPSGLQLFLQAVVHADRRYVRLSLAPTFTALSQNIPVFPIPISIPVVNPDGSISQVQITQFIQLPQTSILSVQTTVMVPDGGTVLMGGFKTLSEGRTEFGPPILSKIPYLNRLFTNTGYGREARSLMIMITPRIIIPEEEEQFLGQQLLPP